jgi:phospholipid-transporting ATPase
MNDISHPKRLPLQNTLIALALCHTIIREQHQDQTASYNASSPDELALVNFAKFIGYEYLGTDQNDTIKVTTHSADKKYTLLHVFSFSSDRKR